MANVKVSSLPSGANLSDSDVAPWNVSGVTSKFTWANLHKKTGNIVSVKDPTFGAVGDGTTDDTTAIQAACTWVAAVAGRALSFVDGETYIVNDRISITGASKFALFGNGATIKAKNGMTVAAGKQILLFTSCTDGYIENLNVDSNRANRTPVESSSHGMQIYTSCARLTFFNCASDNATTDGWLLDSATQNTLATLPTDIHLVNCRGKNAYRGNLSLINSNRFRDYGGEYVEANGTAPEHGVDCEPDLSTTQGNLDARFYGTDCSRNDGYGFLNSQSNSHCWFYNVVANDNDDGGIRNAGGTMYVDGAHCEDYTTSVVAGVVESTIDAKVTVFKNLTFENIVLNNINKACVSLVGDGTSIQHVDGVDAHDVQAALVTCSDTAYVSNIKATKFAPTDGPGVTLTGARSIARGIDIQQTAGGDRSILVAGDDCVVDGVVLINPGASSGGTIGAIEWAAGADRGTLRNVSVIQSSSIPVGQRAIKFAEIPLVIENVSARSAGTDYTTTTVATFTAGLAGAKVANIRPTIPPRTWTPTFKDNVTDIGHTLNYATYVQSDGLIHIRCSVTRNDAGALTSTLNLGGFPLPLATDASHAACGNAWIDNAANDITALVYINGAAGLFLQTETVGVKIMTTDLWENGRSIYWSATYMAAGA